MSSKLTGLTPALAVEPCWCSHRSGTPAARSSSMPAWVSSLRDRSSSSRCLTSGEAASSRPRVADPAVAQVEDLQPPEQAGVDDVPDALVAEHRQAQPQVRQSLQV